MSRAVRDQRTLLIFVFVMVLVPSVAWAAPAVGRSAVQLSFWTIWDGARVPLMERVLTEFSAEYPWITVDHVVLPSTQRYEKFLVAVTSGAPPDVMMLSLEEIPPLADAGLVQPLDEYMARDGISTSMFFPSEIPPAEWNGSIYILPHTTGSAINNLLYYNKEMFRSAGLDDQKAPETWAELKEAGRRLNRWSEDRQLTQVGVEVNALANRRFFAWAFSNGGTYATEDGRTLLFNSEKNREPWSGWSISPMT